MKTCSKCKLSKEYSDFSKMARSKDGLQSRCNSCNGESVRTLPGYKREYDLRRNYGLTQTGFDLMLVGQGGVCAICKGESKNTKPGLCVDHDHVTGNIRGILCHKCNFALGNLDDSPARALILAQYLYASRPQTV